MKIRNITLSLLILIISPAFTLAYIMGEDSREPLTPEEKQQPILRQLGIIDTRDGGFVTGIVTGLNCDVVISAGHAAFYWETNILLNRKKGALRGNGKLLFLPKPELSARTLPMKLIKSGYEQTDHVGKDEHDWSIFRLAEPALDTCEMIEFLPSTTTCSGEVLFPAYHFDHKRSKLIDRTCEIKDSLGQSLLIHDCDTKDGSSGAPLICKNDTEYNVLGMNISGLTLKASNNPSIFGNPGQPFNLKTHKNYAITIHGAFYQSLMKELDASAARFGNSSY
jgi:hypothetical protein